MFTVLVNCTQTMLLFGLSKEGFEVCSVVRDQVGSRELVLNFFTRSFGLVLADASFLFLVVFLLVCFLVV